MKTTVAVLAAAALAGCASLNSIVSDVSSYSHWPAGRAASTYAFERLPSQQANPQQAQMLEDAARLAIEAAGFHSAAEGEAPDVTVQIGARITAYDLSPFDDPFWYGGAGYWHRPFAYGRYGRPYGGPYWGPGWGYGAWGPYSSFPVYEREVAILIRDKHSSEPLYEARARSEGNTSGVADVLPAMFIAALRDFPSGSASNPHRVAVEKPPAPQ
ncbi:MAG TPA: DUF4136 domain-containing protein [Caldimonas sp.]